MNAARPLHAAADCGLFPRVCIWTPSVHTCDITALRGRHAGWHMCSAQCALGWLMCGGVHIRRMTYTTVFIICLVKLHHIRDIIKHQSRQIMTSMAFHRTDPSSGWLTTSHEVNTFWRYINIHIFIGTIDLSKLITDLSESVRWDQLQQQHDFVEEYTYIENGYKM